MSSVRSVTSYCAFQANKKSHSPSSGVHVISSIFEYGGLAAYKFSVLVWIQQEYVPQDIEEIASVIMPLSFNFNVTRFHDESNLKAIICIAII